MAKRYIIEHPYVRYPSGQYFEPNSIVVIPDDEKPAKTWVEVDEHGVPVKKAAKPQPQDAQAKAFGKGAKADKDGA